MHGPAPTARATDAPLTLLTLGGASLARASVTLLPAGKPVALLAYLAAAPGRSASRDHLIDLLWSDRELEPARHAFRQTLWYIRRKAGDDLLHADAVSVRLRDDVASDRDAFLAAIDAGDFDQAIHLYAGDFLPGFAAPGGAQFEQWADAERRRLRSSFVRCAEMTVRRHLASAHARDAIAIARRVRDADPESEAGWRLLLEALVAGEDFVNAAAEADHLERLLAAEQQDPEPATRAALRVARQASPAHGTPAQAQGLVAELIGREAEFASILAAWDDARAGRPRHLHLEARAGIGKSRLLASVHARMRAARHRVVLVRAHQGGHGIPYAFASDLASELVKLPGARGISPAAAGALVALNPSLSTWYDAPADHARDDEALRRRAVALQEVVNAIAEDAPLALLLDDLHWVDLQSRAMLLRLLEHLGGERLLVVTAARVATGHRPVVEGTQLVTLHPLDLQEVGALVASIASLPAAPWADQLPAQLLDATRGSPLLLMETLHLLLEREQLHIAAGMWAAPDPAMLAAALHAGSAMRARVEALPAPARDALRCLAAAGAPVDAALLAATCPGAALDLALAELEQRGLAARVNAGWEAAHDEIATTALESSTPAELAQAHRRLAHALLRPASPTAPLATPLAMRAADHLLAAGDDAALARLFAAWFVQLPRTQRRDPAARARELLGDAAGEARVRQLVRAIPWHRRAGTRLAAAIASVGTIAVIATAALLAIPRSATPPTGAEASLIFARTDSAGHTVYFAADLDESLLRDSAEVPVRPMQPQPRWPAFIHPQFSPNGDKVAFARVVSDTSGSDLYLSDTLGPARLVLPGRADDLPSSWSPDSRRLLVSSGRWSARFFGQVGILDATTGILTRLSRGPEAEIFGMWSPDGSRVAFTRRFMSAIRPEQLCLVGVDGSSERCQALPPFVAITPVTWLDPRRLLVQGNRGEGDVLLLVDVLDWSVRVADSRVGGRIASPDGRWIACNCESEVGGQVVLVHPAERPELARRVSGPPPVDGSIALRSAPRAPRYVTTLGISGPARLAVDATARLRAIPRDTAGHLVDLPPDAIQWRSADSAIALVDSIGIVRPRRTGTVRIEASAGGWRRASYTLHVVAPEWKLLLREDWAAGIEPEFVPYGVPRPVIATARDGVRAMVNNGDGNYGSGVYSRQQFDAHDGLGVRARVSLPVTRSTWQALIVFLTASLDEAGLRQWHHRDGPMPSLPGGDACGVGYPKGEGPIGVASFSAVLPEPRSLPANPDTRDGRWITIELQIFPDGRCGVAIDGVPRVIGRGAASLARPFRLHLAGNSVETRMAVGPVELWSGVRPDVDWRAIDR